jgi:hypothetical protein
MSRKQQNPITTDKLKDVIALHQANLAASMPKPAVPPTFSPVPSKAAELDQDPGGAYNPNGSFPQR